MQNWSQNITFGNADLQRPPSIAILQKLVAGCSTCRVVGAAHSFNDIADTAGTLVSLVDLPPFVQIDPVSSTVTCSAGLLHHELAQALQVEGWALANLPSLPHFNVVGACVTGTHGSGDSNQALAAAIRGLTFVTATGDLAEISDQSELATIAVGLGAFGIVTTVTFAIEPTYAIAQQIYLGAPLASAIDAIDYIMASAYSVSWFLDWQTDRVDQIWLKHRLEAGERAPATPEIFAGGRAARHQLSHSDGANDHSLNSNRSTADRCTPQLMQVGPWNERLPHVRNDSPPTPGAQLQSEYFVARRHGAEALSAIAAHGPLLGHLLSDGVMSEIRTVAGDGLWLSPFSEDMLALHFSWLNDPAAALEALPALEAVLEPFAPKPHWGKLHTMPSSLVRSRYPRFNEFVTMADAYDPTGKFRNPYLHRLFN
ncbi:MAG: xylitol oxidase [Acidimicrobiales bacterium]|jgi:alditol oxidase